MRMIDIHDVEAVEKRFRQARIDPRWERPLRNAFYKSGLSAAEALGALPDEPRKRLADAIRFHSLELVQRHDSELDGATKLVFRTQAGFLIEAVILRIATGRTTLCVSSQIGCAANCAFCATGKMGIARDLAPNEILDQLIHANRLLREEGRRIRNVVFMGMGEPFHNEEALYRALEVLHSPRCFDHPERHVTVSTVGIPSAMVRFADRFARTYLALSLHSARQSTRERLVPLARRHPLNELRRALLEVTRRQRQTVMIEYLMLKGLTDTSVELDALVEFLRGIPVRVNLIPYNPIDDAPDLVSSEPARRLEFADALRSAGFAVTRRYSLGGDVAAACGQLTRRENRRIARVS